MVNKNESQDPKQLEKIETSLNKAELYIENNQNKIIYIVGIIVLIITGFMVYKNFYLKSQEEKAQASIWPAQNSFNLDTAYNIALYGNENVVGFSEIVDKYGSTKTGNLAKYCAGVCCMHLGEYENAIDYLEDFSTDDPIVGPTSKGLIGDAYNELGNRDKAIEYYLEAAEMGDHEFLSPRFLMKAGMTYEKLGKKDKALEVYNQIKDTYDTSPEASNIDKYITRVSFK